MDARKIFSEIKKEGRNILTIDESFEALKNYKIPVAEYAIAKSKDDAANAAKRIGYPVVLKAISKKITHKTDVGGIALNVQSEEAVRKAFGEILKNIERAEAKMDGILVQKMVEGGQEVMIGGKKDQQFGQTIAFGLGGVFVEVFEDIAFRVVPITNEDAEEMMKETKGYKILSGFRGKKYDTDALANILMKVSNMLEENQNIAELDINPVITLPNGKGAIAVDARIVLE
jgi:acetyl-CoA synthetase (ADP-forming)